MLNTCFRGVRLHPTLGSCTRPVWLSPRSPRVVRRQASSQPSESEAGASSSSKEDLPSELQDLAINEDGFLIDTKTGKVINEMGATRFDVAVRALRGELDPPEWVENSERSPGILLSALYQFPRPYLFQVVGRPGPASPTSTPSSSPIYTFSTSSSSSSSSAAVTDSSNGVRGSVAFADDVAAVIAQVTQASVAEGKVEVKERMGGKYVSVAVEVVVRAPELVSKVYDELAKDPRIIMRF